MLKNIAQSFHANSLIKAASRIFQINVLGMLAAFASQVLLARWMGADEFGAYTYAWTWCITLTMLAVFGTPTAMVRVIASSVAVDKPSAVAGAIRWSKRLVLLFGIVIAAIAISLLFILGSGELTSTISIAIAMAAIPVLSLFRLQSGWARGFGWGRLAYAPDVLGRPVLITTFSAIALIATGALDAITVTGLTAAAVLLLAIGQNLVIRARIAKTYLQCQPEIQSKKWLRMSGPLVLVAMFEAVNERFDVLLVGIYLTSADVAVYHAGARVAGCLTIFLLSINALAAPKIAALYAAEKHGELQKAMAEIIPWAFWPTLIAFLFLILFGEQVLLVFGHEFAPGYWPLVVLAFGQVVNSWSGPVLLVLNMTGLHDHSARILGISAMFNVISNAVLIPRLGVLGAAVSTAATMILWNVWMAVLVKRERGIRTYITFGR